MLKHQVLSSKHFADALNRLCAFERNKMLNLEHSDDLSGIQEQFRHDLPMCLHATAGIYRVESLLTCHEIFRTKYSSVYSYMLVLRDTENEDAALNCSFTMTFNYVAPFDPTLIRQRTSLLVSKKHPLNMLAEMYYPHTEVSDMHVGIS